MSSRWLAALALAVPGLAQAACAVFTEEDVRRIARESADALDVDDATAHRRGWLALQDGLPCLQAQLPKDAWASLLVSEAIVRNALGEDWLAPLDTATSVLPDVEGIPAFMAEQYTPAPPAQPIPGAIVPPGATLFVDGVLTPKPPKLTGIHVVQLLRDGTWTNALIQGEAGLPDGFYAFPTVAAGPEPLRARGALSLGVGLGGETQSVDSPGTYLGNSHTTGLSSSVLTHGVVPVPDAGGFALGWDLRAPVQTPSLDVDAAGERVFAPVPTVLPDLYAGAGYLARGWAVLGGFGASRMWIVAGNERQAYWYPEPHVELDVFGEKADFGVGAGATPSAGHLRLRAGGIAASKGGVALRFGADGSMGLAWFEEAGVSDPRRATAIAYAIGGTVGMAWGLPR